MSTSLLKSLLPRYIVINFILLGFKFMLFEAWIFKILFAFKWITLNLLV